MLWLRFGIFFTGLMKKVGCLSKAAVDSQALMHWQVVHIEVFVTRSVVSLCVVSL